MKATGLKLSAKRSVICAALAVAGAAMAPAAHADSYTTLSASNIVITLQDGRPGDGLAPSITFASGATIADFAAFSVDYTAHTFGFTGEWSDSLVIGDIFTLGAGTIATFSIDYSLGAFATLPGESASTTLNVRAVGEGTVEGTRQDRPFETTVNVGFGELASSSFAAGVSSSESGTASVTYYNFSSGNRTGALTAEVSMFGFGAPLSTVTAVPEPGTYAMFLAGLAAMGAVARRRSSKSKSNSAA